MVRVTRNPVTHDAAPEMTMSKGCTKPAMLWGHASEHGEEADAAAGSAKHAAQGWTGWVAVVFE